MSNFSAVNRQSMLERMEAKMLDIIIIGGGITGAGIALDAAARGLEVALFEMQDFAAGTSSRSTKLIHGGLRYLKQLEFNVVAEVGRERAIVYENGPHVTTPEWMLLPLYKKGTYGKWSSTVGLALYDLLAKVKKDERKKMLTREQTLKLEPLLRKEHLIGGGYYVEYKTDDARLTIEVVKKAVELGATAVNYAKVTKLMYKDTKISGVVVENQLSGKQYTIYAKKIINATGPWVDDIRELDQSKQGKTLRLTKGVHLVFDQSHFPLKQAIYFDTFDGRMCFAIPRDNKTYFGTTDTNYDGDKVHPSITKDDQQYLLQAANDIFPSLNLNAAHIESSYVGLRPLIHQEGKKPSEVSRKDEVFISATGLISIAGGKLTGYRKMADAVVNKTLSLMKQEQLSFTASIVVDTKRIPISGGDVGGAANFEPYIQSAIQQYLELGLERQGTEALVRKYGTNVTKLVNYIEIARAWVQQYDIDLASALMLKYAINEEMICTVEDFLIRRTGYMLFDINKAKRLKRAVAEILADTFKLSEQMKQQQLISLDNRLAEAEQK